MAPWHGSLQQPEGPPDSPVTSSALSRQGECSRPRIDARRKRSPMQKELEECFPKSLRASSAVHCHSSPICPSPRALCKRGRRRTPACVTKLEVHQRMQARRDRNGASAYTSGHRAQEAVCDRLCQPQTPAAPSASALMPKNCTRSRVSVPDSEPT